jgi:hypothetical protein
MVVTQTASVLTYSCQYKAVGTWFSPMPIGSFWDPPTQHAFRTLIWENMSYMWHAKIVFWIVEKTVVAVTGRPFFSKFTSPAQTEYEAENGATDLNLLVYDDDVSPRYSNIHHQVPQHSEIVLSCIQSSLIATPGEKLLFGVPALALGFLGVVAPVLFALCNPPDPKAKYFWIVEQTVVGLVKYFDWEDWGINTTFGRGAALSLEHESDSMTRFSDDESNIAGPSTVPGNGQTPALSAVHTEEADIAETDIEMDDLRSSYLKASAWAESSQEPV